MPNTYHDGNGVHTLLAVGTDGVILRNIIVNPISHTLGISDGSTGTDNGPVTSKHDANNIPILMGVSKNDGKTPVAIYADSNGNLLTESF